MLSNNVVLNACKNTELALNDNAVSMSVFNNLLGKCDVVLKAVMRAIDHNGGEAAVNAGFADIKICAVVKVKSKINAAVFNCRTCKSKKVSVLSILTCAC